MIAVRPWLAASLLLVTAQIVVGFVWPTQVLVSAIGLGGQGVIIAHFAVVQGWRRDRERILWWLLATAMLLWAMAFGAVYALRDIMFADDSRALFDGIVFIARGVPLMLLLTSGIDEEAHGPVRWFDIAQAGIFIAAAALLLLGNPWATTASAAGPASDHMAQMLRQFQMVALTILAIGVAELRRNRSDALLFRPLAAMLICYLPVAAIINQLFITRWQIDPGSPAFAIGAVPMILFLLASAFPRLAPPTPLSRLKLSFGLLAPAVLPIATLVVVLTPGRRGDLLGEVLGIAAVLAYGWRMVAIQLRHRRSIAELTAAHSEAAGLSLIDPLTGLGNRRRLDAALVTMLATCRSAPIAGLMIDVDWFKDYNDCLGHAAGDQALRRIGAALADHSPAGSVVVRLGGEEFAVLSPVADIAVASMLAERLRSAVWTMAIPHPRAAGSHLTVSIGVAVTLDPDPDALLAAADTALYAAKRDGRNCIRCADIALA